MISPIGAHGSEVRRRADCALEYIIKPAFEALGYDTPERIDQVDEAGQITAGIIKRIFSATWVVADLSGLNPNVFYEIGTRHAIQKPIIHLSNDIGAIPFDNVNQNTIFYVHDDPSSHKAAIERIVRQVTAVDSKSEKTSTPVSMALGQFKLEEAGDSEGAIIGNLVARVESLETMQREERYVLKAMSRTFNESLEPSGRLPLTPQFSNALTGRALFDGQNVTIGTNALTNPPSTFGKKPEKL